MPTRADRVAAGVVRLLEAFASLQRAQVERLQRASEAVDRLERAQARRERAGTGAEPEEEEEERDRAGARA